MVRKTLSSLIKTLLGIPLFVCFVALAQAPQPIPITGNLGTLAGTPQPYAGVLIQMLNCPSPVSVTGYFGIVATTYQLQANASGLINSTIWPNDLITCNGTTGASQYSLVAVVNGIPSGQVMCYQVTSAQGIWHLDGQQQPIACGQTPPDPQDATYNNLTVNGFLQGNNADFSGAVSIHGLLSALGGIHLGTAPTPCPTNNYMTSIDANLQPICLAIPASGVTSFNSRTGGVHSAAGDYSYDMITNAPAIGFNGTLQTPEPLTNFKNDFAVTDAAGVSTDIQLGTTGITAGACAFPMSVTYDAKGRSSSCTPGTAPIATLKALVSFTTCALAADGGSVWDCTGTAALGVTLPSSTYTAVCQTGNPTAGYSSTNTWSFGITTKTTTTLGYVILGDHSGILGSTFPVQCLIYQ